MAHAQKPYFVFPRNGRVHLNRQERQSSRLLAAEVCASAVVMKVMLDAPCSEVERKTTGLSRSLLLSIILRNCMMRLFSCAEGELGQKETNVVIKGRIKGCMFAGSKTNVLMKGRIKVCKFAGLETNVIKGRIKGCMFAGLETNVIKGRIKGCMFAGLETKLSLRDE